MMRIGVVTLFPELFAEFARTSLLGKAAGEGRFSLEFEPLRAHGLGKHLSVDDTPYGGGSGMVLRVDCVVAALEAVDARMATKAHRLLMTPQGRRFAQADARRLAALPELVFVCGRYEGFDERVRSHVDEELSVGDFVMTGGELAAMAMIDSIVRLLPGVLGNADSLREESFGSERPALEYPHYTRPVEFRGQRVPEVLSSGNHAKIAEWRLQQAEVRTAQRRPDLCSASDEAREDGATASSGAQPPVVDPSGRRG